MSFSRPDPSSPASVADAAFGTSRRGFDQGEVRDFLRMVAAELGRLQERERFLERELRNAQSNPDLTSAKLDDEALTRLVGEETARVLQTARESANEIRDKAEGAAGRMLTEAADEARRLREEAEVESARRRADAAADAEAELDMAKQQGREMVNEARAYRERVLSELARRRELAREQIEQLIHGRDRLMQAFERARLVAVDVVSEMQPLGEPDEYVNLEPTTGPVPVMVAKSARPGEAMPDAGTPATAVDEPEEATPEVEAADASEATEAGADATVEGAADEEETATEPDEGAADDAEPDESAAEADAGDDDAGDDSGDVVVDLFARIRADAVTSEPADDAADTAEPDESAAGAAEVDDDADSIWGASETSAPSRVVAEVAPEPEESADDEPEPTRFERRDEVLTPLIVAGAKKLKRVLADEQNGVLDALRRHHPVRDLDELLPPAAEHAARYGDSISDELLAAANAGAASVATGRRARLNKTAAAAATGAAAEVLDQWLVAPLRERLQRCVSEGDGDNDAITKKARAAYREWKTQHIDEQLDDIVLCAHGRGVLAALPAASTVTWGVDDRHGACADCDDNALAGAVTVGEEFPTGDTYAPAHPGCRCLLVPADR